MDKLNKFCTLFITVFWALLIATTLKPITVKASAVGVVQNAVNFVQNSSNAVNTVSNAEQGIVSPELEQQLKETGRWDDVESLISSFCPDGDTKCAGQFLGYYASLNEVSNKSSSFRKSVGDAVNLDVSIETSAVPAGVSKDIPSSIQEIAQPPLWLKVAGTVKDLVENIVDVVKNLGTTLPKNAGNENNQSSKEQKGSSSTPAPPTKLSAAKVIKNWQLVSGDPTDTCTTPTYTGEVQVRGWYELEDDGEYGQNWVLRVVDEDTKILPLYDYTKKVNYNFNSALTLANASPELVQELKKASQDNPKIVDLKGYKAYCEGHPAVSQESFQISQQTTSSQPPTKPSQSIADNKIYTFPEGINKVDFTLAPGESSPWIEIPPRSNYSVQTKDNPIEICYKQSGECITLDAKPGTINQHGDENTFRILSYDKSASVTVTIERNVCTPNWQCSNWNTCTGDGAGGGQQIRSCSDSNSCGTADNEPVTSQSCTCNPKWFCTGWGPCSSNSFNGPKSQERFCSDDNNCGVPTGEPVTTQSCY